MQEIIDLGKINEEWLIWEDSSRDPFINMALDELLLKNANILNKPLLRFYTWDRPSVSIGYVQKISAAPESGYTVVRRCTGGGMVFHNTDITYTAAIPLDHKLNKLSRLGSYYFFHMAIIKAFSYSGIISELAPPEQTGIDRSRMQCFTTPTRYDIVSDSGSKLAGAAQRRTKDGILHQGSINIKTGRDQFISDMKKALLSEFGISLKSFNPECKFMVEAETLSNEKYRSPQWNNMR